MGKNMDTIVFSKPFLTGNEIKYIEQCFQSGRLASDGFFTEKVHQYFERHYGFRKVLLTASCTDALEMMALLLNIQPGDEVIVPSYTFVSTANAFALRGAKIVFCDSSPDCPNINEAEIEQLITSKTKVIVTMHYGGVGCNMERITHIARKNQLFLVEDAAHGIHSFYHDMPLGSFGNLAAFSFNETKNIISGEGGLLIINDETYVARAEIIREKGTNRAAFNRGEVTRYEWYDLGSSYAAADIVAAFLYAQLEALQAIQAKRLRLWNLYFELLKEAALRYGFRLPAVPAACRHNGHIFYIVCNSQAERDALMQYLSVRGINTAFHYLSLHTSPYFSNKHDGRVLPNADRFSAYLLRLPLYNDLEENQIHYVAENIISFYATTH
jgi:dTDP-4-amino-4,6-dideoxygalactose transaminase